MARLETTPQHRPLQRETKSPGWLSLLGTLSLVFALPLAAQRDQAIVRGAVTDTEGNTLQGVTITVTSPAHSDFKVVTETNKKGEFKAVIEGDSGEYDFLLEKEGYEPFEAPLEVQPGMTLAVTFKMVDEATFRKAQAIDLHNAGIEKLQSGDKEAAAEKFREAAALDPDLAEPHLALATVSLDLNRLEEAASAIETYSELRPSEAGTASLAFEIYLKQGDKSRAARELDKIRDPEALADAARVVFNEGIAASRRGDADTAYEHFSTASEIDPSLAPAFRALAGIDLKRQAYDQALANLAKLLALEPDNVEARRLAYECHRALGNGEMARDALVSYLKVAPPEAAEEVRSKGHAAFENGEPERARQILLDLLAVRPDMPLAHYSLGLIHISRGKEAKGKDYLKRFVELAPDHPEATHARQILAYLEG